MESKNVCLELEWAGVDGWALSEVHHCEGSVGEIGLMLQRQNGHEHTLVFGKLQENCQRSGREK